MSPLAEAARALAAYDRRSPAVLVQTPIGTYVISPNGYGHGPHDAYVISRHQLHDLMRLDGLRRDHLTDPEIVEELATRISELREQRSLMRSDRGKP